MFLRRIEDFVGNRPLCAADEELGHNAARYRTSSSVICFGGGFNSEQGVEAEQSAIIHPSGNEKDKSPFNSC